MDKWQAQYNLWSSFGMPVYDANSVPDGDDKPDFPYITYTGIDGMFDTDVPTTISVWTRGTSWRPADSISDTIYKAIENGGIIVPYDGGIIWVTPRTPFSQNFGDPSDDLIRRKIINVTLHFC